jgi:hypothetical protein
LGKAIAGKTNSVIQQREYGRASTGHDLKAAPSHLISIGALPRSLSCVLPLARAARVAMGADPQQTLRAFREAEAYEGPSLIIAYSHCIAHGIEMRNGLDQQYRAVASGHWPLIRYDPLVRAAGGNPFLLDSPRPRIALGDYIYRELRYSMLANSDPVEADRLLALAQQAVDQRWAVYEEMATYGPERFAADAGRSQPAASAKGS